MQAVRNFFIDRFSIDNRFHGFHSHTALNETPVVFFRILFDRIVAVTKTLSVTTVSALKHIEVQPGSVVEPSCWGCSATRMEGHQVILVDCFDRSCQCLPFGCFHITANVSTDKPNDIRFVLITFRQELSVCFRLFDSHFSTIHGTSPDTNHTDIQSFFCSRTNDIIHVIPITIYTFPVDVLEVISIYHGILSVDIHGWHIIQGLNLNYIVSAMFALFQIIFGFVTIQTLWEQPSCFPQPEERSTVFVFQITPLFGDNKFTVAPGNIRFLCFLLCRHWSTQAQQ